MFSSFFSVGPTDPTAPNFHPVSARYGSADSTELFGELEQKDTEWLCASGFVSETQVFYTIAKDGTFMFCQVIHSSIGVWYPTIQFTCRIYNPHTKETTWKSINVSNFVTPIPGRDKRSCKADEFSITHKTNPSNAEFPESYFIQCNLGQDLQISLEVQRPGSVPGFKVGKGPKGGYSYFGHDLEKPEGYVIHRFWPRYVASGHIVRGGSATPIEGSGIMIHAIQGMRPNLVAASWNFGFFNSEDHGGVTAVQMEFKTTDHYGLKGTGSGGVSVSVGSLVVGNKLVSVVGEFKAPGTEQQEDKDVKCRVQHVDPVFDAHTGYKMPSEVVYRWQGPSLLPEAKGTISATTKVPLGKPENVEGLIEKVDFLAEVPYVVKMAVNYVAGTKPFIYQNLNPTTLSIKGPEGLIPGEPGDLEIKGVVYNEATFISS